MSQVQIFPLGDTALTVVFGAKIDAGLAARTRRFCAALAQRAPEGVEESAPAFASATIWYDPDKITYEELARLAVELAQTGAEAEAASAFYEIPFCAEAECAPDLAEVAHVNGLTPRDYLARLSEVVFEVFMLGFLPGFAYLGGLPHELSAPRLATPRKRVPAGSVAIADGMCAAYPFASPGGWRLIGRTPAPLFDAENAGRPALLAPGDRLRWREIGRDEFFRLERSWRDAPFDAASLRAPA